MATALENTLISRLRAKMGDNPTYVLANDDVGKNIVLIDGTAKVAEQTDIGLEAQKIDEQIWNDAEYLVELNSATVQLTKAQKTLSEVSDYTIEMILVRSQMNLVYILAIDATRYLKYNTRDLDVEKMTPTQFLEVHKSLSAFLKELLIGDNSEDPEVVNNESIVVQSIVRRYDSVAGALIPSRYNPPQKKLQFNLLAHADGIQIDVMYSFIKDYAEHYLMRKVGAGVSELVANFTVLETHSYIDTDVTDGLLYTYELHVRNVNGADSFTTGQLTYAKP